MNSSDTTEHMTNPNGVEIVYGEISHQKKRDKVTKTVQLKRTEGDVLATSEVYMGSDYFSVYWITQLPVETLVNLMEKCLSAYETEYSEGVKGLNGEIIIPTESKKNDPELGVEETENNAFLKGVIIYKKATDTERADREMIPSYDRPLNLEKILGDQKKENVGYLRVNTPIGDFGSYLDRDTEKFHMNFGFLTHLAELNQFAQLLVDTSEQKVSEEEAMQFVNAIVSLYTARV
jgi:hypothetical protein